MSSAPITSSSSSSSSPSHLGTDLSLSTDYPTNFENITIGADLQVPTESSANLGYLTTAAISWLILNWIIALCLVHAENRKKGKKVARNEALELPAGDIPAELKEDGLHELDIALPELNEDTFHEMFVPPVELSGDMWPELQGRPSSATEKLSDAFDFPLTEVEDESTSAELNSSNPYSPLSVRTIHISEVTEEAGRFQPYG
ncbi:hypothetical protein MMC22_007667 [Lobaria immixta]|nr:hypothetical protein [Lobaria immixta]